jgi:hypothetical protein
MLGQILWAHKLFLACLVLSVLALTSLHVSQVPPVFEAETLVLEPPRRHPGRTARTARRWRSGRRPWPSASWMR